MTSHAQGGQETDFDRSAYKELFLEETSSFLSVLRTSLIRLEKAPNDGRALQEAHRAAHTLKGMASTMRYHDLAALAATLEGPFLSKSPLPLEQIKILQAGCNEFEAGLERLDEEGKGLRMRDE